MKVVVDASVVVKWALRDPVAEPDTDRALALLQEIRAGRVEPVQPLHWLVETIAVVSRLRPKLAPQALSLLEVMELPVLDRPEVYRTAVDLAIRLDHHLFDTLYHAVALESEALLVTADKNYFRKVRGEGTVRRLADWIP